MVKVALFRGLHLINVARRVVVMHLMWWWQPFMRYFRFPSSLRVWRMNCNSWGRTFDPDFAMFKEELLLGHVLFAPVGLNEDCLGHDVSSDELVLGRAEGPTSLLFWAGPYTNNSRSK